MALFGKVISMATEKHKTKQTPRKIMSYLGFDLIMVFCHFLLHKLLMAIIFPGDCFVCIFRSQFLLEKTLIFKIILLNIFQWNLSKLPSPGLESLSKLTGL